MHLPAVFNQRFYVRHGKKFIKFSFDRVRTTDGVGYGSSMTNASHFSICATDEGVKPTLSYISSSCFRFSSSQVGNLCLIVTVIKAKQDYKRKRKIIEETPVKILRNIYYKWNLLQFIKRAASFLVQRTKTSLYLGYHWTVRRTEGTPALSAVWVWIIISVCLLRWVIRVCSRSLAKGRKIQKEIGLASEEEAVSGIPDGLTFLFLHFDSCVAL